MMTTPIGASAENRSADEEAVLQTVLTFLGGIAACDKTAMLLHMSLRAVVERLSFDGKQKREEPIYDSLVKVDRDIAMAWTPYRYFIDGALHHCGTNIFSLHRQNGRWLISGVADYSRAPDLP